MGHSSQTGQLIVKTQTTPGTYDPDTGTDGVSISTRAARWNLSATSLSLIPRSVAAEMLSTPISVQSPSQATSSSMSATQHC